MKRLFPWFAVLAWSLAGCSAQPQPASDNRPAADITPVTLTDAEWRERLSPAQYRVLRQAGTEAPGSSPLLRIHEAGTFVCAGCELPLFETKTKFESGTGWPSFYVPIAPGHVLSLRDTSLGMVRNENVCARCGGHLGHVFEDGPPPTGLRYCINGAAMTFVPAK